MTGLIDLLPVGSTFGYSPCPAFAGMIGTVTPAKAGVNLRGYNRGKILLDNRVTHD